MHNRYAGVGAAPDGRGFAIRRADWRNLKTGRRFAPVATYSFAGATGRHQSNLADAEPNHLDPDRLIDAILGAENP